MMATNSPDADTAADEAFERLLLASAKLDAPSDGAAKVAWGRFVVAAANVATIGGASPVTSASRTARSVAKWLAWGALVSAALVAAYVEGTRHGRAPAQPSSAMAPSSAAPTVSEAFEQRPVPPATHSSGVALASKRSMATRTTAIRPARTQPAAPTSTSANLREEVARLDAARTALAIGDFNVVFQTLERYRVDFPNGVLAREGDLVAISALSEKGDRTQARLLARRFLANYPHDVHAARVKQIVSWQELADGEQ
jgi:hypothetical protein